MPIAFVSLHFCCGNLVGRLGITIDMLFSAYCLPIAQQLGWQLGPDRSTYRLYPFAPALGFDDLARSISFGVPIAVDLWLRLLGPATWPESEYLSSVPFCSGIFGLTTWPEHVFNLEPIPPIASATWLVTWQIISAYPSYCFCNLVGRLSTYINKRCLSFLLRLQLG